MKNDRGAPLPYEGRGRGLGSPLKTALSLLVLLAFSGYHALGKVPRHAAPPPKIYRTALADVEAQRRNGHRVRLSRRQLPGLPKIGWVYDTNDDGKRERSWQKITVTVSPLEIQGRVSGFSLQYQAVAGGYYLSPWAATDHDDINLALATDLGYLLDYSGAPGGAYLYRPQPVPPREAAAVRRRLRAIERPLLYGFFSRRMTDPRYFPDEHHKIMGRWGKFVRRVDFGPTFTPGTLLEVPAPLKTFVPQIRVVWLELSVRVDGRDKPIKRSPPFAKIIAFETASRLYLVEQHAVRYDVELGAGGFSAIDMDDK